MDVLLSENLSRVLVAKTVEAVQSDVEREAENNGPRGSL